MGSFNVTRFENAVLKAGLVIGDKTQRPIKVTNPDPNATHYGTYFIQNEKAVCVSVCSIGDAPDGMYDHFPQYYTPTIKSFIAWMQLTNGKSSKVG